MRLSGQILTITLQHHLPYPVYKFIGTYLVFVITRVKAKLVEILVLFEFLNLKVNFFQKIWLSKELLKKTCCFTAVNRFSH